MKKLIALVALAVIGVAAFAGEVSVGARLGGSYDVFYSAKYGDERQPKFNFGGAVWGNIALVQSGSLTFGLQPEAGLSFNRGYEKYEAYLSTYSAGNEKVGEVSFTQLEFPVLAMLDFALNKRISLGVGAGPFFAFGLGYKDSYNGEDDSRLRFKGGITLAVDLGIAAGPGKIIFDVRSDIPLFGTLSAAGALGAGLGYQFTF